MIITNYRLIAPILLGLCLLAPSACAPTSTVAGSEAQIPPMTSGMARVWFLRDRDPQEQHGTPVIYANGQPVGRSQSGAAFFRDVSPGNYAFTVQSYDIPTGQKVALQLAAGTQTYLDIQWGASWQQGVAGGETFYVQMLSPELGQAYLHSLRYLGPGGAVS
jgi:hypothetical protein